MVSAAWEVSAEADWVGRSRVHPKLKKRRTVQSRSTEGAEARESTRVGWGIKRGRRYDHGTSIRRIRSHPLGGTVTLKTRRKRGNGEAN
jgi:hypothetical protein